MVGGQREARRLTQQQLIVVVRADHSADHLPQVLSDRVSAAVVAANHPARAAVVSACQRAGVAALLAGEASGDTADGRHADGSLAERQAALASRKSDESVGVTAENRHEAMLLGEAGADYIWFAAGPSLTQPEAVDLCAWWSALFEVPAVMAGPLSDVEELCATGADFIAIVDLFDQPDPAAAMHSATAQLGDAAG